VYDLFCANGCCESEQKLLTAEFAENILETAEKVNCGSRKRQKYNNVADFLCVLREFLCVLCG
jgi:Zn ribbon nucleic-acid-binding protein